MEIEQIWAQYQERLRAFLRARLSDPADVEDLLQDILLKSVEHRDQIKTHSSIQPWLFQVARSSLADFYRARGKQQQLAGESLWYQEVSRDQELALGRCLAPMIQALPPESAELLTKFDLEGESQKRYAKQQGISYSTLKSRVQKGRQQLRQLFERCCYLSLDSKGALIDCTPKNKDCSGC